MPIKFAHLFMQPTFIASYMPGIQNTKMNNSTVSSPQGVHSLIGVAAYVHSVFIIQNHKDLGMFLMQI
jgi:hypothetical protein